MSLLLNMLSRLVVAFLPRSKRLLISWLQSPSAVILEPPKIKSDTVSTVSPSVSHEVMGQDAMILVFWMLRFKPSCPILQSHELCSSWNSPGQNAGLDESQAEIKNARRNMNHLRYGDGTTLMAESEEELKSLLIRVEEESWKTGLTLRN